MSNRPSDSRSVNARFAAALSTTADKSPVDHTLPEQRFFGRRKGQQLTARKQNMLDNYYPRVAFKCADRAKSLTVSKVMPGKGQMWLEIGFGKGEHLVAQAEENPDACLIGCEPYINGVVGLLDRMVNNTIDNVRVYADDARHVMNSLADASLDRVFLIHPDPWPKRRHARRRFVNPLMLDEIARLLKPGGEFRVATDHPIYREWTCIQMCHRTDFSWLAEVPDDWRSRPGDWPVTRYAEKALEGEPVFLIYRRVETG